MQPSFSGWLAYGCIFSNAPGIKQHKSPRSHRPPPLRNPPRPFPCPPEGSEAREIECRTPSVEGGLIPSDRASSFVTPCSKFVIQYQRRRCAWDSSMAAQGPASGGGRLKERRGKCPGKGRDLRRAEAATGVEGHGGHPGPAQGHETGRQAKALSRVLDRPGLPNDRDLDLPGIAQLFLDLLRNIPTD